MCRPEIENEEHQARSKPEGVSRMLPYPQSFGIEDRERVFRFLATFFRWECALKHNGFSRSGAHGQAEPDWKAFAVAHDTAIKALQVPEFVAARDVLLSNPPRREVFQENQIVWVDNPRRLHETADADYLLRVVRDVRNNLFHGGKFVRGSAPELARDQMLIDSAVAVLEVLARLHSGIRAMHDQSIYSS